MKVSQVIQWLSKLDQESEIFAWWITKDYAERELLDLHTELDPQLWADSVAEFEDQELPCWSFVSEDLAAVIRERLPIPYALTDKGARSV